MRFLQMLGGLTVGGVTGVVIAFAGVFLVWPNLAAGIDWDALGPGGFVIFLQWALILGLIGGGLGALGAWRQGKESDSVIDTSFAGMFLLSIGFVVIALAASSGISACYHYLVKS